MAVAAAGAVSVGCSSSSDSDDSASAGAGDKTGSAGKSNSGDSGGDSSTPSEGGAAGAVTDTPAGGDTGTPSGSDAGAAGTSTGTDPGGDAGTGSGGSGGAPVVVTDPTAAAVARAKKLITGLKDTSCPSCHQPTYSGAGHWPNITPDDDTGIGTWSDDDIKKAITKGVNPDGRVFCAEMPKFVFSESELSDVLTFLHSLKPVKKTITQVCK